MLAVTIDLKALFSVYLSRFGTAHPITDVCICFRLYSIAFKGCHIKIDQVLTKNSEHVENIFYKSY